MFPQKAVNSEYSNYVTVKLPICLEAKISLPVRRGGGAAEACTDKSKEDLTRANVSVCVSELLLGI